MEYTKEKQKNVKLYTKYKMFSWDMLFYYAIIFLFFTQVKNIAAADVLLAESAYPLFKVIFLIPATILISRIGKRKSIIAGNIFILIATVTYITAFNFIGILIGELLQAIGFIIKGICETNILYDSLEKNEKRGITFSKIDGRASSLYYYIDAISSVLSGFLFSINAYLPMICCLITNIFSVYLSFKFEEIDNIENTEKVKIRKEFREIVRGFKSIFRSSRLKNLLVFGAVFCGILGALVSLRSSLLSDINVPSQYFGIIFAVLGIISGIAAKNQFRFHNKFKNRTLAILSLPVVLSCIVVGVVASLSINQSFTLGVVLIVYLIHYISKGPFNTLIRQYLNNFTTSSLRNKISSSYNMLESLFRSAICFLASFLLRYTTTSNTFIILGCMLTIIIVLMLDRMRTRVGLRPEEYKERDIKNLEIR